MYRQTKAAKRIQADNLKLIVDEQSHDEYVFNPGKIVSRKAEEEEESWKT